MPKNHKVSCAYAQSINPSTRSHLCKHPVILLAVTQCIIIETSVLGQHVAALCTDCFHLIEAFLNNLKHALVFNSKVVRYRSNYYALNFWDRAGENKVF